MVYLSRLIVSPRCAQVRSEIANPFEMRRTLERVFGLSTGDDPEHSDFLYRIDTAPRPHALIQTKAAPDWSKLCAPPGYLSAPPEVKKIQAQFHKNERFKFRLRANPTLRSDGKRYGLYTCEEQADWLVKKGERAGFRIDKLLVRQEGCMEVKSVSGRIVRFATVQYDGELTVANPYLFYDAFENGIGSAKGLGYGLLSLARC